ncbi:MAG: LytR/AlgR family response regulator transcription factor [Gammaproteobacteria bacterium]
MIRVLIVDDEPNARQGIRSLLAAEADIQVIGECGDGNDALEKIETLQPDAMFLDIQIPGLSGIDMLHERVEAKRPYTIIVSAYEDYSLQAFDVNVKDYLLKPIDSNRFKTALTRLRSHVNTQLRANGLADIGDLLKRATPDPAKPPVMPLTVSDRVPVKIGRRVRFLSLRHIRYVKADGNYVNMHMTTGEVIHTSERISQMETKLFPHHFIRAHRSIIINIDEIREVYTMGSYYEFLMTDGQRLTSGVTYKKNVQSLLTAWKKARDNRAG